jgi:hypothetical protein
MPGAVDTRKQKFAQMLKAKVSQGYGIESQGDTEAVLFTRSRRRWFGLFAGHGAGARQRISIDDQSAAKTRKLSPTRRVNAAQRKACFAVKATDADKQIEFPLDDSR